VKTLTEAVKLLYGYNQMVKRDPQYKLDKSYSPKTNIDDFLIKEEIKPIVSKLLLDGEVHRRTFVKSFGDYEKQEYIVELLNGEIVNCWPNSGSMVSLDKSGRMFDPQDVFSFKLNPVQEC